MRSFLRFNQGMLRMPMHLQMWVVALVGANIVAPLFFLQHLEAQLTLAAGLLGLALMSVLTGRFGFSRIVGLGHVAWLPLIVLLLSSAGETTASSPFGLWIRSVIVLDSISLAFDFVDAARFYRGDRTEMVAGLEHSIPEHLGPKTARSPLSATVCQPTPVVSESLASWIQEEPCLRKTYAEPALDPL